MRRALCVLAAAVAVFAAGCGGGDGAGSEGAEAPRREPRRSDSAEVDGSGDETAAKAYCEALVRPVTDYDAQIIDMSGVYAELYELRDEHPDMTEEQLRWTNLALRENKEQSGFQRGLIQLAKGCKDNYDTPLGSFGPVGGWDNYDG